MKELLTLNDINRLKNRLFKQAWIETNKKMKNSPHLIYWYYEKRKREIKKNLMFFKVDKK